MPRLARDAATETPARPLATEQVKKRLEKIEKEVDEENNLFYFHIRPLGEEKLVGWGKIYRILWPSQIGYLNWRSAPRNRRKATGGGSQHSFYGSRSTS